MTTTGFVNKVIGRMKEAAGSLLDDDELRREGRTDQKVAQAKETSEQAIDAAREKSEDFIDAAKEKLQGDDAPRSGA